MGAQRTLRDEESDVHPGLCFEIPESRAILGVGSIGRETSNKRSFKRRLYIARAAVSYLNARFPEPVPLNPSLWCHTIHLTR